MTEELKLYGYSDFKFLGSGVQGCVILAKLQESNIRHAIKGIRIKNQNGVIFKKEKESCDNEIKMLTKCSGSPYTLSLINVIEGKQMNYLVLNECKGTLEELVHQQGGRLSELSAIKYSKDIAEGIHHIHKNGFIIQDLKLDNILIDYNNNAVVGDLGLGNKIQSNASYGEKQFEGNMMYCAPEVQNYYFDKYTELGIKISNQSSKRVMHLYFFLKKIKKFQIS